MAESNNPLALPSDFDSEQNGLNFAIRQAMLKLRTAITRTGRAVCSLSMAC